MAATYDRTRQDLGNITLLEHVNVAVPDQSLATIFYLSGLGLTTANYWALTQTLRPGAAVGRSVGASAWTRSMVGKWKLEIR